MDARPPFTPPPPALARQLLAGLPQAVLLIDANGTIAYANTAAETATGRSAAQLAGTPIAELFAGSSELLALLERAAREEAAVVGRDMKFTAPAAIRRVDMHALPLAERPGDILI
ncbi:MAG: PAS domain-containing protein, partial [Alphaproteobacteria bacterium]